MRYLLKNLRRRPAGCLLAECLLAVALAIVVPAGLSAAPPEPDSGGLLVLDDSDSEFKGQATYSDRLTRLDRTGNVTFEIGDFNGCQSIGSSHLIAVDAARGSIWVIELVGKRLRRFDRRGRELLTLEDLEASAAAVDPETGNLWLLTSKGTIHGDKTCVIDPEGKRLATYTVSGFDIAYDPRGKCFWIVSNQLTKIDAATGKVVLQKEITKWCASSVAVHPRTGQIWVAVREHPQVDNSHNELLVFEEEGALADAIPLGESTPFQLSIDSRTGSVWVTIYRRSIQRYSQGGEFEVEVEMPALACAADPLTGGVWIVTPDETIRMGPDGGTALRRKHTRPSQQAWIATE
ncbi:MAG: hypothetical protein ACKV0T_20510 [Planctomycetales bacterium]